MANASNNSSFTGGVFYPSPRKTVQKNREVSGVKDYVNYVTSNISKSVGVMRRLHCQLPANVMVKLYYSLVYSNLTYALLAWGSTYAAKIECAHRRACKLLKDYNQKIPTFHSIYDYFPLFKAFNTNTLNFH